MPWTWWSQAVTGRSGIRLLRLLADGGHRARGLIRNPDHADDLEAIGAEAVVCDMEALDDLSECCAGADAVVFAAGAGPGSGPERKRTVDYGAAVKLMEAGVRRYVMVSAISAGRPEEWSEEMRPYYEAKAGADERLTESGLDYTIVRPGGLTDDPGTGRVRVGTDLDYGEHSPRRRGRRAPRGAGDARARWGRRSSWSPATRRSTRPSARCERASARRRCSGVSARCPRGA